jgi:hypothetical protein
MRTWSAKRFSTQLPLRTAAQKLVTQLRGMDAGDAAYEDKIVPLSEVI